MFIELHDNDGPILINMSMIDFVSSFTSTAGTYYSLNGEAYYIKESYEEIKDLIKMAAGVVSKGEE